MASAELLKVTHSVNDGLLGVDERVPVEDVYNDVHDVGNRVQTYLFLLRLARIDLGPCREIYCIPTATSLACSGQCRHQNTSLAFYASTSAFFS